MIGIAKYNNYDDYKFPIYGIRGVGPDYKALYDILHNQFNYKQIHIDWPWDFIAFETKEDEARFENLELVKKDLYIED
jgi:hypothetical protein